MKARTKSEEKKMTAAGTYLLPFRRAVFQAAEAQDLARYFTTLRQAGCEVLLIDGSPADVFAQNKEALGSPAATSRSTAVIAT